MLLHVTPNQGNMSGKCIKRMYSFTGIDKVNVMSYHQMIIIKCLPVSHVTCPGCFLQRMQCSHCKRCTSYSNSVCLSVRPSSVTRRYCVKTTARSTVQFRLFSELRAMSYEARLEILRLLQRAQCSHCKRCISYSNSVRPTVCLSVCLSVRLSVTRRYCVKTTACSTVQFPLSDSKMCLVCRN